MDLIINGKPFHINDSMQKSFEKAVNLSALDICLEIYMRDESGDSEFDSIVFLNTVTGEYEITYVKFLRNAIKDTFFDFIRLFVPTSIVQTTCQDVKIVDMQTILNKDLNANILEPVFLPENDTLLIYIPNTSLTAYKTSNILADNIAKFEAKNKLNDSLKTINSNSKTITKHNVFTKEFTVTERLSAINKFLKLNEDTDLFMLPLMNSILRVYKVDGSASIIPTSSLIENPSLGINSVDDLLSLGIFKQSINKVFKYVSVCDIRHAYKHFKTPEDTYVSGINYTVDNNILYIVYATSEIVTRALTLKNYSLEIYSSFAQRWEEVLDLYDSYHELVFYVHRNNLPDCIAVCNDDNKSTTFYDISNLKSRLENFSYEWNSDISMAFPIDRIIDLNEFDIEDIVDIRLGTDKSLDNCNIKQIRDDDEISIGYNINTNMIIYTKPKY